MIALADTMRTTSLRLVGAWNAVTTRYNPFALIALACAVLTGPLIFFRGYNSDEGLAVTIARTTLEDGEWLVPYVFNVRWVERPTLLSWIIAALSAPFGQFGSHVSQITARLPVALFVLFGCVLIFLMLRRVAASVPAALFGVALFLACPLVIRSSVLVTADLPLAVTLFFAFYLWWCGNDEGSIGVSRWLAIGVVLALAGLFKGPQPIAFFALGVGFYILASRSWRQFPGLILAGIICIIPLAYWYAAIYAPGDEGNWAAFMRVRPVAILPGPIVAGLRTLSEIFPAALAAAAFFVGHALRRRSLARPGFVAALSCYAFIAAIAVLFWPGGSLPRYYLPMVLPLCVFGGLGYDLFGEKRPQIIAPIMVITAALLLYASVYALASPFLPLRYRQAWFDAEKITAAMQTAPGPLYRTGDTGLNVLPYVPGRILIATPDELASVEGPAWILLPNDEAVALVARRSDKLHVVMPLGDVEQWRLLRLDP
jgi:4-amino-4-deoxy-L-arabinose transferase-like glycosyltransferase